MIADSFHIAIIEDNPFYRKFFSEKLRMLMECHNITGHELHLFDNPSHFLDSGNQAYRVIFLDYFFDNNLNASDVIHLIRKKCDPVHIYVLSEVLSTTRSEDLPLKGIDGFIPKDETAFGKCSEILLSHLHMA